MPGLNLNIDKNTYKLSQNEKTVKSYIATKKKELMLQAGEERLTELYKKQIGVQQQLMTQRDKTEAAQRKLSQAQRDGLGDVWDLAEAYGKEKTLLEGLEPVYNSLTGEITALEKATFGLAGATEDANVRSYESTLRTTVLTDEQLEQWEENYRTHQSSVAELTQTFTSQMGTIEDEGIEHSKITAKEVKKNLEAQIADFNNWYWTIKSLSRKVPPGVLEELKKLGPGYYPMLQELNQMTETELSAWVNTFEQKTRLASYAAEQEFGKFPTVLEEKLSSMQDTMEEHKDDLYPKSQYIGKSVIAGMIDGLDEHMDLLRQKIKDVSDLIPKNMMGHLGVQSPSKVTKKIGAFVTEGLALGIESNIGSVRQATLNLSNAAIPNVNGSVNLNQRVDPSSITSSVKEAASIATSTSTKNTGDITIPIYIGGSKIYETVITEAQRANVRAGRTLIPLGV